MVKLYISKRTLDSGEISNSFVSKSQCCHQSLRFCIRIEPNFGQLIWLQTIDWYDKEASLMAHRIALSDF